MQRRKKSRTSLLLFIIFLILGVLIFIITPTENPLSESLNNSEYNTALCLPLNDGNIIYHPDYWLCYSEEHEQAKWVATVLRADRVLLPTVKRSNIFLKDPDIATGSAVTSDYTSSGFDRGHLLSFASNGWNEEAGNASFYMSNISPQYPNTNRYTYERIEEAERSATVQNNILFVVHGPVLTDGPYKTIGKENRISVPNYYFVCFLDYSGETHKAIGFLVPNDNVNYTDFTQFAVSVDTVEKITNLDFWYLLPDEEEEALESEYSLALWDFSSFNRTKAASKYGYNLDNLVLKNENINENVYKEAQNLSDKIRIFLYENFGQIKIEILSIIR